MTDSVKKRIPVCPLMSAAEPGDRICLQERCAWWINGSKTCAIYIIAHNNVLDIKNKQGR